MVFIIIIEGIFLGLILVLYCAASIRNGSINMVFLYHQDVQERCVKLGLISDMQIKKNKKIFTVIFIPLFFILVLFIVYAINQVNTFSEGFLQTFALLSIVNLIDRFFIDEYWVGHTNSWIIPGTEDMRPYINCQDKIKKWLMGTFGFAILSGILAGIMSFLE